jgi:hypothetical protein
MPGGTGGPHRIQGVGFWAQQKYYNIFSVDSGPFIFRSPFEGLPKAWWVPPANAFQSWTHFNINLFPPPQQIIKRGPLKGLPEQGPTPLLQQSIFQAFPPLYTVTVALPVPLAKELWETPAQLWRLDQTWTWSYNLNLIGQDAMLVGEQRYELAPSQVAPDQIQLRSWQWSYNLSLIGKDRMLAGKQVYDLAPGQRPPEQIQVHSWTFSYNLNLIGKDQVPTGEQIWELAPSQKPPEQIQLHSWVWSYNLNLIGQDRLPVGEQIWERPTLPIPPALTWLDLPKYNLIAKPFAQYDWPNATPPYRIDQTWAASYNLNLIGQDKLPTGEQISDLPPRDFVRLLQTWIQQTNIALLTQPLPLQITISKYFDRPILPIPPAQSWEFSYNKNLIGQDQLPFRQSDWPNPIPPALVKDWIQQTNLALLTQPPALLPYRRAYFDLPIAGPQQPAQTWTWQYNLNLIGKDQLPIGAEVTELAPSQKPPEQVQLHSWAWSYNLNLVGQDQLPFRQQDWPLTPAAQRGVELATWLDRVKFWLLKPFAQYDWPNPTQPFRDPTLATIARGYNLDLIGQDQLPNRQQDWPLSAAFIPISLQTWIAATNFALLMPATPLVPPLFLRNQDWPNPTAPAYPNNLRAWPTQGTPAPIIPGVPPPPPVGPAVYNKPMLAGPGYLNVIPGEKPS